MRVGQAAYYNGLMLGYFGSIVYVTDDGIGVMHNNTLGWVFSDKWQWDDINKRWWVDLMQHKSIIQPAAMNHMPRQHYIEMVQG